MKRFVVTILCLCMGLLMTMAQTDRDYIRRGNRLMRDTVDGRNLSDKAMVQYKKAVEKNESNAIAHYNLGNSLIYGNKGNDALKEFQKAAKLETDKRRLSDIYHNMGVLLQNDKQFDKAVDCYKMSLRNDPSNNETRYNMVLCQRQMKKNKQDQQDQQNKQDQQKQDEKKEEKQQKQDQQKQDEKKEEKQQQQQQQMSKDNAEQMLNAAMQKEKNTQEKIKRQQQKAQDRHLEKQW